MAFKERVQEGTYWRKELADQGQEEGLQGTHVRAIQMWLPLVISAVGET